MYWMLVETNVVTAVCLLADDLWLLVLVDILTALVTAVSIMADDSWLLVLIAVVTVGIATTTGIY